MYKSRPMCIVITVIVLAVQFGRAEPPQDQPFGSMERKTTAAEPESLPAARSDDPQGRSLRELGAKFLTKGFKSSWAPDGKRLVFGHQETPYVEEGGGLSILDVTTGKATTLVPTGKDPSWAPGEGQYIAYVDGGYGADEQIWVVEPSGENRRRIVDGGFPSWSPDGKTIYFHCRKQMKFMSVSLAADAAAPDEILNSRWWYPAFCADGNRVAYRSGDQLVLADCETGTTIKQFRIPDGRGFLGSWSPDGGHIGYGGYGFHDAPGLWIVDVRTGVLKQLSPNFVTMPVWSPDGSKISMDLRLRSGFEVWVVDANVLDGLPEVVPPQHRYAVPEEGIETLLKSRVQTLHRATQQEKRRIIADLSKVLKVKAKTGLDSSVLRAAMGAARTLESTGDTELAADAYDQFAKAMGDSEETFIARYRETLQGAARRLRLPGSFLELKGTLLDGSNLNWESYRGRVVLVGFWTTWSVPCRAEIHHVKKYYELYHDRGFDVIGISLHSSRQAMEDFVERENLPWVTLYDDNAGGSHPIATYYGVTAIPTVILVDKEGKVVSLQARGAQLGRLLHAQLGAVEAENVREVEEPPR